jgi:hypothetical protein
MRRVTRGFSIVLVLCLGVVVQVMFAMPNFARKYNMSCTGCHNPVPRLNEFGFKFRAAGFRTPDEIGKGETSSNIGDYFAGRTQASIDFVSSTNKADVTTTKAQLSFREITLYPLTGSFAKNYSSMIELSVSPEDFWEIENGYVRANFGTEAEHFSARLGIFHPFEGYGASDRPLGLSRPLFQTTAANYNKSTGFTPWNFDQMGLEFGYTRDQLAVRATIFNGLFYSASEAKVFPAQSGITGELVKPSPGNPYSAAYNSKDVQLFGTYLLTDDGGGISGYAYFGNIDLPAPDGATYLDAIQRYAVYGSYPLQSALFLGGFQSGVDDKYDVSIAAKSGTFTSIGLFGEADYGFNENVFIGARYDKFYPQRVDVEAIRNAFQTVSLFANVPLNNGLQFIAEYQNKTTEQGKNSSGTTLNQTDNSVQVRMIFIY